MRKYGDNLNKTNFIEKLNQQKDYWNFIIFNTDKLYENLKQCQFPDPEICWINNEVEFLWKYNDKLFLLRFSPSCVGVIRQFKCWNNYTNGESKELDNLDEINIYLDWLYNKE